MNITLTQLTALLPLIIIAVAILVIMLAIAWRCSHRWTAIMTSLSVILSFISVIGLNGRLVDPTTHQSNALQWMPLIQLDGYALFYMAIILIAALVCTILAYCYLQANQEYCAEFYLLLLCATLGAMVLVISIHMASLFLGLELMSVALYGMAAFMRTQKLSLEAGIKYMILSAMASAFLLFGMALLYAAYGTLSFGLLGLRVAFEYTTDIWTIVALGMMVIGLGFKLSIVPFHMWTPDVYQGSPIPTATFIATVSKVAIFAVLLRLLLIIPVSAQRFYFLIGLLAILSMLVGNLLALLQTNVKRLLAYSSIAHLGYLLSIIVALRYLDSPGVNYSALTNQLIVEASGVYLTAYVLTLLGAFGILSLLSSPYKGTEAVQLHHIRGIFWRRPFMAIVLSLMMLSLAGIPLTAGFIAKFYVIAVSVEQKLWWLALAIVLGSGIALYYYLRVIITLYLAEPSDSSRHIVKVKGYQLAKWTVIVLAVLTFAIGVFPQDLVHWLNNVPPIVQ